MAILAIDYGLHKIGIAVSDERRRLALPVTVIRYTNLAEAVEPLKKILQTYEIDQVVLGKPLHDSGSPAATEAIATFTTWLQTILTVPIAMLDERFTTQAAVRLREGMAGDDDATAAMVLLQDYLDRAQWEQRATD